MITFASIDERRKIESLANKAGLSLNNYVRQRLGLKALAHGGARDGAGRKKTMYFEVALYEHGDEFTVTPPADLGEGWAMDSDLIHEAADGYPVQRIEEADLPKTLNNPHYTGLAVYRLDGQNGFSYFGVYER